MADLWGGAAQAGAVVCAGSWKNRTKAISIAERDGQLVLEMGAGAPMLYLANEHDGGAEVWPMRWLAVRDPPSSGGDRDAVYVIELPTPTSPKLMVRRPAGDGVVEFERCVPSAAASRGTAANDPALSAQSGRRSRSPSRKREGGVGRMLPGDWSCPRCGDHQFARNTSCRSCATPKPKVGGDVRKGDHTSLVALIKRRQRDSHSFREKWWEFCNKSGTGFFDPARHEPKLLEEFFEREMGGVPASGASRSRSRSRSGSADSRGSSRRSDDSRSRSRKRRRKTKRVRRKKRSKREKHSKGRRRGHAKKRRRRGRSASESSSRPSGLPSRAAAIKAAKREIARAKKALQEAKEEVAPVAAEILAKAEAERQKETERLAELGKQEAEEDFAAKLRQAEQKMADEKASRMHEAEQRLDAALASRLQEIERRLRVDLDSRVEEVRQRAEENSKAAFTGAESRIASEAAARVQRLAAELQKARAKVIEAQAAKDAKRAAAANGERKSPEKSRGKSRAKEKARDKGGEDDDAESESKSSGGASRSRGRDGGESSSASSEGSK